MDNQSKEDDMDLDEVLVQKKTNLEKLILNIDDAIQKKNPSIFCCRMNGIRYDVNCENISDYTKNREKKSTNCRDRSELCMKKK